MVITAGGGLNPSGGSGIFAFSTVANAIHGDCLQARRARYASTRGEGASGSNLCFPLQKSQAQ